MPQGAPIRCDPAQRAFARSLRPRHRDKDHGPHSRARHSTARRGRLGSESRSVDTPPPFSWREAPLPRSAPLHEDCDREDTDLGIRSLAQGGRNVWCSLWHRYAQVAAFNGPTVQCFHPEGRNAQWANAPELPLRPERKEKALDPCGAKAFRSAVAAIRIRSSAYGSARGTSLNHCGT